MTTPPEDSLLAYEFDQFQRYGFLRRILETVYLERPETEKVRLLDVGSGPERLTATFVDDRFEVVRCDVESFGQDDIVVLNPNNSYPFSTGEFDVVVALEVLEHIQPRDRTHLLDETLRAARDLVILSVPDGRSDVAAAEGRIGAAFHLLAGEPHPFLREHSEYGLPTEQEVRGLLDERGLPYAVAGNSPLDRWEAFLMLDQVLRTVQDGPELASELCRRANAATSPGSRSAGFYRNFYVLGKDERAFSRALEAIKHNVSDDASSDLTDPVFQLSRLVASMLSKARLDLQAAVHSELETADRLRATDEQLAESVARIRAVEQVSSETQQQLAESVARIRAVEQVSSETQQRLREQEHKLRASRKKVRATTDRLRTAEREAKTLTEELELVRGALATLFFELDPSRATPVIRGLKRLLSRTWQNHPFAAEPSGRLVNVLSGGHSIWCVFGPDAHLTIRAELAPGRYRLNARASAIGEAALVGSIGAHRYELGNVVPRLQTLSKEIVIEDVVDEICLAFDRPVAFAAIGDFHILRYVEESRVASIGHNTAAIARGRKEFRWLAHSRISQPIVRRLQPPAPVVGQQPSDYESWISRHLEQRAKLYPRPRKELHFSILTTVWNTPARYLEQLAQSVSLQNYRKYEWILLDNGSTDAETIATVAEIGRREHVRFERVDGNLGIIRGMRRCLERASGRYFLPVDSDDYLYPDAFRVLCDHLVRAGYPPLAYSDEDKQWDERFLDGYLKPDWDPVLFLNSCYIAHLCAIHRARAIELGAYTDQEAEGCHDWDTFIRFMLAGHTPLHVPEVLYSWRMHPESAALNIGSKPYLDASHRHVLGKFIAAQANSERYHVVRSPLWGPTPDWQIRRTPVDSRPIVSALLTSHAEGRNAPGNVSPILVSGSSADLRPVVERAYRENALLQLLWDQVQVKGDDWLWEVLGLTELHSDIVMVGGRVHDESDRIVAAGEYFGFGGACDCPDVGRSFHDPGYFGQMWKQRSVSAVSTMLAVCKSSFLLEALEATPADTPLPFLGAWLGAHAARAGRRVVYTPFLTGACRSSRTTWDALIRDENRHAFAAANADLIPDTRYLSPLLSLDPATPYAPASAEERERILTRFGPESVRDTAQALAARR